MCRIILNAGDFLTKFCSAGNIVLTCGIFLFGAANFFLLKSGIFSHQTLVMDKMYLLAYEIHVKITTFYGKHSNKGVYRLRGAGKKKW